jgi:hypothetical protein
VVGPVVSLRFDEVVAENFPGGEFCDGEGLDLVSKVFPRNKKKMENLFHVYRPTLH